MSLSEIRASFLCDECGAWFSVSIGNADRVPPDWSMYEMAEDACRGSLDYENNKGDKFGVLGCSSVQDGKHLCSDCTMKADADCDDDDCDEPEEGSP